MLQSLHERAQGWIAWIIVSILALTLGIWGIEHFFTGNTDAKNVVASIGNHEISQRELNLTYDRLRRQQQLEQGDDFVLTPEAEKELKKKALDVIIKNYVVSNAAYSQGFRVSPGQIETVLASIPVFQENGNFSIERYKNILSSLGYSQEDFINQLRTDMMSYQAEMGYLTSAFALPSDINNAYRLFNQRRDFNYLIISKNDFLANANVSFAKVEDYYKKHQADFKVPEQVSVYYVELNLQNLKSNLKFADKDIKQFYLDNPSIFSDPAQWHVSQILIKVPANAKEKQIAEAQNKINQIAAEIKQTNDFSKAANKYSEDILSAKNGGLLPWFASGIMDAPFEKAVENLKVGQISQPVRTKYGFQIIKLLEAKPKQVKPFELVKSQVENTLAQELAQKIFAKQTEQLTNLAFTNSDSLTNISKTMRLPIKESTLFSRGANNLKNEDKENVSANPKVTEVAFSGEVLNQGYNSSPIEITPERLVVIRLKEHKLPTLKSLSLVKNEIIEKLNLQNATLNAKNMGQQLLKNIEAGQNPPPSNSKYQWKKATNVGRYNTDISPIIINQAFALERPDKNPKPSITGIQLPTGDYALVQVLRIIDGNAAQMSPEQMNAFKEQLAKSYGQLDYQFFVKGLIQKEKVKTFGESKTTSSEDSE